MYRTITFYGITFQKSSITNLQSTLLSYNPGLAVTKPVWAVPRSLATTWGITIVFSSSGYLDVSVPRVCSPLPGFQAFSLEGCPIRKSPDRRLFAPPRSLSQLTTSFIASESQGIRHTLLITFFSTRNPAKMYRLHLCNN